jgi:hypothetical protein
MGTRKKSGKARALITSLNDSLARALSMPLWAFVSSGCAQTENEEKKMMKELFPAFYLSFQSKSIISCMF